MLTEVNFICAATVTLFGNFIKLIGMIECIAVLCPFPMILFRMSLAKVLKEKITTACMVCKVISVHVCAMVINCSPRPPARK